MAELFENNILGLIPNKDWLSVGFDVTRPNDPVDGLFGDEKTNNLVAYWESIASEYQIPVMAQFHGFDTEAQKAFRIPIDTHNIEKGLIKVKMNQSERLRAIMRAGVTGEQSIYEYVMNDGLRLAEQVVTRSKVAKNELLATGKVTIKENNVDLTVDYGVPAANTAFTLDLGPGAASDLPTQLAYIVNTAMAKGVILTGMCLSNTVLTKIRANAAIQKAINGTYGAAVRNTQIREYLADEYGINQVVTNDLSYSAPATIANGLPVMSSHRYFPTNKVSFFAVNNGGKIGTGLWGDPPEVDAAKFMQVEASGASPFVYISQWAENDPAVLWTKASALYMPVLYNPSGLYIATTQETPAS